MDDLPNSLDVTLRRLYLLASLTMILLVLWETLMPQHRKTEMRLRLLRSCIQGTRRIARRAAAASMRAELAGGGEQYEMPFLFASCALRLESAYQRARDVTL